MSGCDYMKPKFSVACNARNVEQMQWDLAFMKPEEFMVAYNMTIENYRKYIDDSTKFNEE
jgi:hypothetical protein